MRKLAASFMKLPALVAVALLVTSTPALAQTPDGETPFNEGVCDELLGATPGLYGLCVAYCEAQDLDEFGDAKIPNEKILAVYNKKRQAADPGMPCIQAPLVGHRKSLPTRSLWRTTFDAEWMSPVNSLMSPVAG